MRSRLLWLALVVTISPGLLAAEQPAGNSSALDQGLAAKPQIFGETLPALTRLVLDRETPTTVAGSYDSDGGRLHFRARRLGEEAAEVRFWSEDGSFELESRILSRSEGWIRSGGVQISGRGEVAEERREMIVEILESPFGKELPRLSLEMGCRLTQQGAAPLLAAFVQPWQILFKLSGSLVAETEALRLSPGCSYRTPTRGRVLVLQEGEPMAYVPFFNTLDAEGAAHQALSPKSTGPCGAMCRGACGADCTSPFCTTESSGCEFVCPTHPFCQWHDACYDSCNSVYGCSSLAAWSCKRLICDEGCVAQGYSSDTCAAWSQGLGPSTGYATYNECDGNDCYGGDGGAFDFLQVVREPGVTVTEMNLRDALSSGPMASALEAGRIPSSQALSSGSGPGQPDATRRWRSLGPDGVYSFDCGGSGGGGGDGGGGTYCTDCTCTGEFTSWEGEVCGSTTEELVDACWDSCY